MPPKKYRLKSYCLISDTKCRIRHDINKTDRFLTVDSIRDILRSRRETGVLAISLMQEFFPLEHAFQHGVGI